MDFTSFNGRDFINFFLPAITPDWATADFRFLVHEKGMMVEVFFKHYSDLPDLAPMSAMQEEMGEVIVNPASIQVDGCESCDYGCEYGHQILVLGVSPEAVAAANEAWEAWKKARETFGNTWFGAVNVE